VTTAAKIRVVRMSVYDGEWIDGRFVTRERLKRSDLVNPTLKPSFIVYLSTGERILIGWTEKGQQRQFNIKDVEFFNPPDDTKWALKVVRIRGGKWAKVLSVVNKGMAKWFQGGNPVELVTAAEKIVWVDPILYRPVP